MISSSKSSGADESLVVLEHKRQSSTADDANSPTKRQAILPSEADREMTTDTCNDRLDEKISGKENDISSSISVEEAKAAKAQVKEALLKRKQILVAELRHLDASGSLLDFADSDFLCSDAPSPTPTPAIDDEQNQDEPIHRTAGAGRRGFERWNGLSEDDKLLLQKAKAIEANNRHKIKWPEPPRRKIHHDYLMEEMSWLATDFRNERKWKIAQAKKVASAVVKYHNQQQQKIERAEKDKEVKVRKQATKIAREVRRFWMQIETLAQHKQQAKMDIEKKKVLGKHLDFLVDQTEKYSTMIAQNLTLVPAASTAPTDARNLEEHGTKGNISTAKQAPQIESGSAVKPAVVASRRGTRRTQLRGNLPDSQDSSAVSRPAANNAVGDGVAEDPDKGDTDFKVEKEEEDDEATIEEDEMNEDKEEIANEVNELQAEQDMPIEELLAKYGCMMKKGRKGDSEDEDDSDEENDEEEDGGDEEKSANKGDAEERGDVSEEPSTIRPVSDGCAGAGEGSLQDISQSDGNQTQIGSSAQIRDGSRPNRDKEAGESSAADEVSSSDEDGMDLADEGGSYRSMYRQLNGHASDEIHGADARGEANSGKEEGQCLQESRQTEGGDGLSGEARDVADMARTLAPTGHTLATTRVKTAVPALLSKKLRMREYQHIALDWMIALYDKGLNGILADEMGLGKTIMTISVLAYLACERGIWGPHLIVVPTSLLLNWEIELKRWCPAFKVLTYYGSPKERKAKRQGWSKANSFHVCISSYKMVVQDQKMFRRKKWKYLILDEAHNIKNFQSQRWQVLLNFRTKRRLLLTGTPLQNNLMELWSLLHFLMPHIFTSHSEFKDWFANPLMSMVEGNSAMNDTLVQRLHSVLRPFILRRLKKDVEKQLPEKKEHVVTCRLSKRQRCLYDDFLAAGATQAKLSSGNLLEIINVLMQLRKVCNHPDLFEERPIVSPFDCLPVAFVLPRAVDRACAREPRAHVGLASLNFLLAELEACDRAEAAARRAYQPPPPLIEELCGPGWERPAHVADDDEESGRGLWTSVAHYRASLAARQRAERARSLSLMMRVNALRCDGAPVYGADLCRAVRVVLPAEDAVRASEDPRRHAAYPGPLRDLILRADERVFGRGGRDGTAADRARRPQLDCCGRETGSLLDMLTNFVCIIPRARCAPASVVWSRRDFGAEGRLEEVAAGVARMYSAVNDVCRPAHIRQQLYFPDKRLLQYDCGKLQVLDGMLRRLKAEGHRVLLFTQMSKVLDVVETFLCFQGHTYIRLDGSTKIEMRQKLVERFNQDPKVFVFISSTRAGGVGINLTGADTVVFYDSDWNPAMDRQAQDRCHRIGQTREVHIYRLVSEHTVEENILRKANQKRYLEDLALKDSATSLFNPDFFKKVDVRELFHDEPAAAAAVAAAAPAAARKSGVTERDWEAATAAAEDETDAAAARLARAEEREEAHEFDEEAEAAAAAAGGEGGVHAASGSEGEDAGRGDAAALRIEDELTPVQRYALRFVEEQLRAAAAAAPPPAVAPSGGTGAGSGKEGWEAEQLRKIQARDDDRLYDEDEVLLYETAGCRAQG